LWEGSNGILDINYFPKGQSITADYYSSLQVQLKGTLREKRHGKVAKVVLFLHENASPYRALGIQKNLAYWASSALIIHPILLIWPRRTTTCSLYLKNNWKATIFHPTWSSLLPWRTNWTDKFLNFLLASKI
jgi:hypothetical protein